MVFWVVLTLLIIIIEFVGLIFFPKTFRPKFIIIIALAIPTNDKEANLITVVDSNFPNINKISVHMKGSITGGSNAGVRVIFIGK